MFPRMKPTSNRLIVEWLPTMKVGSIFLPESERDYHNSDSVKMFKVIAAGPGKLNRKGVFIPNEIKPGENVIVDARVEGRPQEMGDGRYMIANPEKVVLAVIPVQPTSASVPAGVEC